MRPASSRATRPARYTVTEHRRNRPALSTHWSAVGSRECAVPDDEPDSRASRTSRGRSPTMSTRRSSDSRRSIWTTSARAANEEASARAAGSRIWRGRWRRPATPPQSRRCARHHAGPHPLAMPTWSKASRWRRWSPGAGGSSRHVSVHDGRGPIEPLDLLESFASTGHGRRRAHADRPQGAGAMVNMRPRRVGPREARGDFWRVVALRGGARRTTWPMGGALATSASSRTRP